MPGKVNPTQCEALTMIAAKVMENDVIIEVGGAGSFADRCAVEVVTVKATILRHLNDSLILVTALNPHIGYYKAAAIAQKAYREGITLRQAAIGAGEVTAEEFDRWVDPTRMVRES